MCWDSPTVGWLCRHSHFLRSYCWQANKRGLVSKRQKSPLFLSSRAGAQTQVSQFQSQCLFSLSYWRKLRPSEAEASLRAATQGWWEMTLTVHNGRSRGTPRTSHALGKTPSSTSQMHQFFSNSLICFFPCLCQSLIEFPDWLLEKNFFFRY